ncbi:MAG: DMT family transporter [Pseudomonadota bacterium]
MPPTLTQNRPTRAIALKLVAVFLFIAMGAMVKVAVAEVPAGQAVFFRSFCALPIIMGWLWQRGELATGLKTARPMGHVWRGLFGTSAMALTFSGLGLLPLPEVTAIGYATPIFTVVLAAVFLGERIRIFRLSAVGLGLVGVMIVVWPRLTPDSWAEGAALGALMILAAALLRALVQIHVRRLVQTEHTAAIVFYFSITATLMSLLTVPLGWVWPSPQVLALMIGTGLLGGIAQILVTSAYRYGAASMLAPFDYASLIFAAVIGYVIFSEVVTLTMAVGAGLVVAGGALIIWRERHLGAERDKARPVTDRKF